MLRRIPVTDWVIAALFAVVAVIECTFISDFGPHWAYLANAAIHVGLVPAMLLRRVRPVPAFLAAYALLAGLSVLVTVAPVRLGVSPALFAAPLAVVAITRHGPSPRWGYAAILLGVAGSFGSPALNFGASTGIGVAGHVVVLLGCYLYAAQQRQIADRHERDLAEQARAHEEESRRAAEAERTMIAREVHDIVAHNLAVVRVQASTALAIGDQQQLRDALTTIKGVTDEALAETRGLVGSLRTEGQPGPGGDVTVLPALAAHARASGVDLTADLPDAATLARWHDELDTPARLALVRVTQEMLTNMIKHAGPGPAALWVREREGRIAVDARNAAGRPSDERPGHGLAGLRERAELVGGSLVVTEGADFQVHAEIPVRSRT